MVEIRITKEIGNYEPKFLGPLTIRQTVCLVIAAPCSYFLYKWLSPIVSSDIAGFFMMIPGALAALFGWIKPYGMHTEKFLRSIFVKMLLAPTHRAYKTENQYEVEAKKLKEAAEAEAQATLEQENKGQSHRKRKAASKEQKYKRSQDAIM